MACVIPWRCERCGETGAVELEPSYPTRKERMWALLSRTTLQHRSCLIVHVYWDFPPCYENMEFPE